jgi:hypothetical protein
MHAAVGLERVGICKPYCIPHCWEIRKFVIPNEFRETVEHLEAEVNRLRPVGGEMEREGGRAKQGTEDVSVVQLAAVAASCVVDETVEDISRYSPTPGELGDGSCKVQKKRKRGEADSGRYADRERNKQTNKQTNTNEHTNKYAEIPS